LKNDTKKLILRRSVLKSFITKGLVVFIIFGLFSFIGCSSLKPVPYSLANDAGNSASISFLSGGTTVSFVYYNNDVLPDPERKTYWDPIMFPSGVPLDITVHAYYHQNANTATGAGLLGALVSTAVTSKIAASRSVDIDVLLSCPPLEAGKKYTLDFRKEAGSPGLNKLILTDIATKTIVHQQIFEMR
jgi:hypothetical protein